jgi:hypothetical protein
MTQKLFVRLAAAFLAFVCVTMVIGRTDQSILYALMAIFCLLASNVEDC